MVSKEVLVLGWLGKLYRLLVVFKACEQEREKIMSLATSIGSDWDWSLEYPKKRNNSKRK